MVDSLTIDANVFLHACGTEYKEERGMVSCMYIISRAIEEEDFRIAIDNGMNIFEEYMDNLKRNNSPNAKMLKQHIQEAIDRGKMTTIFSTFFPIDVDEVRELLDEGFHEKDLIYVRVAPKTNTGYIISTDGRSIMEDEYKEWIENNIDVEVFPPKKGKKKLGDQ